VDLKTEEKETRPRVSRCPSFSYAEIGTDVSRFRNASAANLGRQIDSKQKALSRAQEDVQSDSTEQQNEIVLKILQKLLPIIEKYAKGE